MGTRGLELRGSWGGVLFRILWGLFRELPWHDLVHIDMSKTLPRQSRESVRQLEPYPMPCKEPLGSPVTILQ